MGLLYYTDEYSPDICKQYNKILKVLYICLLITFIIGCYNITCFFVAYNRFRDYKNLSNYTHEQYLQVRNDFCQELFLLEDEEMSKDQILSQAKKEVPVKMYIFINIKPWKKEAIGGAFLAPRVILVDASVDNDHYTIATVHELLHMKIFTMNERYTQFQTFVTLYESNNKYFHKVALILALETFDHRYSEDYNCMGNIIEYMLNRG